MLYEPGFSAPSWAKDAVIYQIFPDRFRNGRKDNDPKTGDVRYDTRSSAVLGHAARGLLPQLLRRQRQLRGAVRRTRRRQPDKEQPRGRDYFGGDLKGVDQQLDYLKAQGVNTIYFNPIFDAGSNHGYDTQDYTQVDPYFGTQKDWENLVKHAKDRGMRIILDGVFNHLSSDSPFFDRYDHYATVGRVRERGLGVPDVVPVHESRRVPAPAPAAAGPNAATYNGWFGFDSIPVINKSLEPGRQAVLPRPAAAPSPTLAAGRRGRLAHGRRGRRLVPERLLGDVPRGRQGDQPGRPAISETGRRTRRCCACCAATASTRR